MKLVDLYAALAPFAIYPAKPPVSRTGAKTRFVANELKAFGLTGEWDSIWLNDLCPLMNLLHRCYTDETFRNAVAERIWAMIPCPVCCPDATGHLTPADLSGKAGCEECGGTGVQNDRRLWEWVRKAPVAEDPVQACADGLWLQSRSFQLKAVTMKEAKWRESGYKPEVDRYARVERTVPFEDNPRWKVASKLHQMRSRSRVTLTSLDARLCLPTGDASDTFVVLDPPYQNTTGYVNTSSRDDVLFLASEWKRAGALVVLHEAVPLAAELGEGWESRPASCLRGHKGNWRGFQDREWITFNRPVVWWPT